MIQKLRHTYEYEPEVIKKDSPGERKDFRSSRWHLFFNIDVLKDLVNFAGKHQC